MFDIPSPSRRFSIVLTSLVATLFLTTLFGCYSETRTKQLTKTEDVEHNDSKLSSTNLLEGDQVGFWNATKFGGQGEYEIANSQIRMDFGYPMTGVTYSGDFPKDNFEISFEARRVDGIDFFATTTFPVADSHCSFITGGWGGAIVGLSNVDGEDASHNSTKSFFGFDQGTWYQFRIRVALPTIECWIDDKQVVELDTTDREIDVRSDVGPCKPFSFCSFETVSEIRDVNLTLLETTDDKKK